MNKILTALCLGIFFNICAFAQTDTDEYDKNEYFVGFSHQRETTNIKQNLNGAEASYTRNVHRYFGIKGDFSVAFKGDDFNYTFTNTVNNTNFSFRGETLRTTFNFLGGIQVKDNASTARFKPFVHALAGVAHNRSTTKKIRCTSGNCPEYINSATNTTFTQTGFAAAFGGGLDIRLSKKVTLRAIQIDYNPIYSFGRFNNNVRFGTGLVF